MPKRKSSAHADRAHSELPPSSSDKWLNCWNWKSTNAQHVERYGTSPSSAAAEEGTAAHEKFEAHLTSKSFRPASQMAPAKKVQTGGVKPLVLDVDDADYDDLIPCIEWVQDQPGVLYPETHLDYGAFFGYEGLTGTGDVTLVEDHRLTIADLKFGRMLVEVADADGRPNPQLMCYLLGAVHRYGRRDEYRIVILQPRAWHKDGPIREFTVTAAALEIFIFDVEEAIKANYSGKHSCTTGPWCRKFCDALPSCRAVVEAGRQLLRDNPPEDK